MLPLTSLSPAPLISSSFQLGVGEEFGNAPSPLTLIMGQGTWQSKIFEILRLFDSISANTGYRQDETENQNEHVGLCILPSRNSEYDIIDYRQARS